MLRPASLFAALLITLALAACSSSDPSGGSTGTGTTTGTGGSTGQGGQGGQGAGSFACKGEMCQAGKEQCDVDAHDVGSCFPLPKACLPKDGGLPPTCACFTDLTTDCSCFLDPKGNFVIQCATP